MSIKQRPPGTPPPPRPSLVLMTLPSVALTGLAFPLGRGQSGDLAQRVGPPAHSPLYPAASMASGELNPIVCFPTKWVARHPPPARGLA